MERRMNTKLVRSDYLKYLKNLARYSMELIREKDDEDIKLIVNFDSEKRTQENNLKTDFLCFFASKSDDYIGQLFIVSIITALTTRKVIYIQIKEDKKDGKIVKMVCERELERVKMEATLSK